MLKPRDIEKCPFCGTKDVKLEKTTVDLGFSSTEAWKYVCNNCKRDFTTTESDEISLKN